MDILLSSFVKKYINTFNANQLQELNKFLDFEDEILNFYNFNLIKDNIDKNEISKIFKNFKFDGGEGGSHERVAPLLVFKTSAFNRSATSPEIIHTIYYYQSL